MRQRNWWSLLKQARKNLGHSLEQACGEIGVSLSSVYKWKRGAQPRRIVQHAIALYVKRAEEYAGI